MAFRKLEGRVPRPIRKPWGTSFVFRFAEQTIHQAIIQKLARSISGLHGLNVLLERGLFQELGVLQRAVDEIDEDVWFLSLAVIDNDITARHREFLRYFYAEEFTDPFNPMGSHVSRGMVKREKIRAYVHNQLSGADAARGNLAGTKAYSVYVHAASPHIMDMYGGIEPRFDLNGESKPYRYAESASAALNCFDRALLTVTVAAKAFGDEQLAEQMTKAASELEEVM
jgi:hypothetical protein